MTPGERRRAGRAVAERISALGMNIPDAAEAAGLDPTTVRAVVKGQRWPLPDTLEKLEKALEWESGEITRQALGCYLSLAEVPAAELIRELGRRVAAGGFDP